MLLAVLDAYLPIEKTLPKISNGRECTKFPEFKVARNSFLGAQIVLHFENL